MIIVSVLFGLAFAVGIGVADVLSAGLTRRMGVLRTVFLLQLISVLGMSLFALWTRPLGGLEASDWILMSALTALVALFYLGFFKALQLGPIALVGPIVAAHSAIIILLAMFVLGEPVGAWKMAAIAATICGVALASVDWRALGAGRADRRKIMGLGVALAVAVCIAAGFWQFAIALLSRDLGWFVPVYLTRLFMVALLVPIVAIRREWPWRPMNRKLALTVLAAAVLESLGLFAFTRGSEIGIVSIVAAASTAYPVVPIIGGIMLFGERLSTIQLVGLIVVFAGLFALTLLP